MFCGYHYMFRFIWVVFHFAWVPHLETGSSDSAVLFSSYRGIAATGGAIALMAYSCLAAVMGFRYVIKEYSGFHAILIFSYPMDRKAGMWAKIKLLLGFITFVFLVCICGSFTAFAAVGHLLGLVDDSLQVMDFVVVYRNTLVLACLVDGIGLCSVRIGFIKKSNSVTVISAILISILLANVVAAMNDYFMAVLCLAIVLLLVGLLLISGMAKKIDKMEI